MDMGTGMAVDEFGRFEFDAAALDPFGADEAAS